MVAFGTDTNRAPDATTAALPRAAAQRAERIERLAWHDIVRAAGPLGAELGLEAENRDGALILRARHLDSLLFNRVIGLATDGPVSERTVAAIPESYARRAIRRYWIHVSAHARSHGLEAQLDAQGFARYPRSWMKFLRGVEEFSARPSSLDVRPARPSDADEIAAIVGPAFDLPEPGGRLFANVTGRSGWHVYVATDAERIVAAGALFVAGELGYHAFAATRPEDRGRGAQSLLMQVRIGKARALGCRWLATETGAPQSADEANPSYQNILRCGFQPADLRANYGLPGTKW
ncbi:MAG TPA: hypothetical protein VLT59_12615 [Steroidobacteraceae bacterium]|nr:hypothetical protein [Steroidobacteraceae bacterium]